MTQSEQLKIAARIGPFGRGKIFTNHNRLASHYLRREGYSDIPELRNAVVRKFRDEMLKNRGFALPDSGLAYIKPEFLNVPGASRKLFGLTPEGQQSRDLLTQAYRRDARSTIAHEGFHMVPILGRSESLAKFYGGWKAPRHGTLGERLRSGWESLEPYWRDPGSYAGRSHFIGQMAHRLLRGAP
jgi:hypothetical protein